MVNLANLPQSNFVTSELLGREAAKHKQCRFTLAKEPFFARSLNGLLQKNSPFTEAVNQKYIFTANAFSNVP